MMAGDISEKGKAAYPKIACNYSTTRECDSHWYVSEGIYILFRILSASDIVVPGFL